MQRLSVLFPVALGCYEYRHDCDLPVGTFVRATLGKKKLMGVVWDKKPDLDFPQEKLKPVLEVLPLPPLPPKTIHFINWVAAYTMSVAGAVLKMALHPEIEKTSKKPTVFLPPNPQFSTLSFSSAQEKAVRQLLSLKGFQVALLDGVTGSGKTEVYFEALSQAFEQGKQVLVLLPEIILTTAWLTRFEKRFGVQPALWHSSITPKTRRDTWEAVRAGTAQVVVGARSALFLPFQDLGLIVVDEEHDASFKQEDGVLYNARDMAIVRASQTPCPVILASATPSLETYCNAVDGRYKHVHLPERFAGASLPQIDLVDMRHKEKGPVKFISKRLQEALAEKMALGEQSLLFINRRGYAPLVLCRACGARLQCPHCSAWLTEHRKAGLVQCHHCGYSKKTPSECPCCHEKETLVACGPGVERLAEEVLTLFPNARIAQITSDTLSSLNEFEALLEKIHNGMIDILIGTQMLAKGHHFPNLTLVGVVDADMSLSGGDLRAGERTFQLLNQVMGRAGREAKQGLALLQTYSPDNLILKALQENDRNTFLQEEMISRQLLKMPPYGKLVGLIISGKDNAQTYQTAKTITQKAPFVEGLDVLGPVVAPIAKLRDKHRYRILIKADKQIKIQNLLQNWLKQVKIHPSVDVRIDIDPYSFF